MDLPGIVTHKIPLERGKQKTGQREAHTGPAATHPTHHWGSLNGGESKEEKYQLATEGVVMAPSGAEGQKSAGSGPLMPSWSPPSQPGGKARRPWAPTCSGKPLPASVQSVTTA